MLHSVNKLLLAKYIDIKVMCSLIEVTIHNLYKVCLALFFLMAKCVRIDGLCIGDTIQSPLIRNLCNRVEGSQQTILLCTVAWVCSR